LILRLGSNENTGNFGNKKVISSIIDIPEILLICVNNKWIMLLRCKFWTRLVL